MFSACIRVAGCCSALLQAAVFASAILISYSTGTQNYSNGTYNTLPYGTVYCVVLQYCIISDCRYALHTLRK